MPHQGILRCLPLILCLVTASAGAVEDYSKAQFRTVYTAPSLSAGRMVADYAIQFPPDYLPPANRTIFYVRGMGDPGTRELVEAVDHTVTWDPSEFTGFRVEGANFRKTQRGFHNQGPPFESNVYQLQGKKVGFLINTESFSHTRPTTTPWGAEDGGPHIAYSRRFDPPARIFNRSSSELTLQVVFKLPWLQFVEETTAEAQAVLLYYIEDRSSGFRFAHVIQIFDRRPFGKGNGSEFVATDSLDYFVSSPLRNKTRDGVAPRYVTKSPYSRQMLNHRSWTKDKFFRAHVKQENLLNIIEDLVMNHGVTGLSTNPKDWRLLEVSMFVEVTWTPEQPMATSNISLGGSFHDFGVFEAYQEEN